MFPICVWLSKTFLKNSLVTISCSLLRTSLVSSATLLCKMQNIFTMSMLVLSVLYNKGLSTNNFCHPVFNGQYQDGWNTNQKQKWKMQTRFALHFKFWRYFLKIVRYNHQIFYFLLSYINFYISRYNFPQILTV